MLTQLWRGRDEYASNGNFQLLRQCNPHGSCFWIGIGVIFNKLAEYAECIGAPDQHKPTNSYARAFYDECSSSLYTLLALFQNVTQGIEWLHNICAETDQSATHSLQNVLVNAAITEWLQMFPIKR